MNRDAVNEARKLFDAEWTKLVVDAEVPKAFASSIEVHNVVNSEARCAIRRPVLAEGEEKTMEEYELLFEEEYDGDVPNMLVGLKFPNREVEVEKDIHIPFWQFVLRKLAERQLKHGVCSSRELLNLENAELAKLRRG
jgi:hypothetical protein